MGDALFVHGGVTDAQEARLALAGLFAVQGATLLDVRTGVMHGAGSTALVTGTSNTGPMKVSIAPHNWVTSRGVANGPYLGALAAAQLVDIAAAPGSGTRIDVVYVKQQDPTPGVPTPDTGFSGVTYGVKQGTVGAGKPSLAAIVGAEELATVAVSAGAVRTTDGTVLITNTARQVVARGAPVPVRSQAERDALDKFPNLLVSRLDTGDIEMVNLAGSGWVTVYDQVPPAAPTWQNLSLLATWWEVFIQPQARLEGDRVFLRGWVHTISAVGPGGGVLSVALPANMRPAGNRGLWPAWENAAGTVNGINRWEIRTDGLLYTNRGIGTDTYVNLDGLSWAVS